MAQKYAPALKDIQQALVDLINDQWKTDQASLAAPLRDLNTGPASLEWDAEDLRAVRIRVFTPIAPAISLRSTTSLIARNLKVPVVLYLAFSERANADALLRELQGLVVDAYVGDPTLKGKCIGPADGGDPLTIEDAVTDGESFIQQIINIHVAVKVN